VSKKPKREAWGFAPYDDADIIAIHALIAGTATADHQRRGMAWIINQAAGTYDQPYHPGENADTDTVFACGRMFVGQQIVKLSKLPPKI